MMDTMEMQTTITVEDESEDRSSARFVVTPLERGYGTTLGNSLRRVLLSSLPGVAVVCIKIDGVLHEISTINGVREDVTEIVLAVKSIIARLYSDEKKTVFIDIDHTGSEELEVTARDIVHDDEIKILNPNLHICTLCGDVHFHMELTFDHGRGYVSEERNKQIAEAEGDSPIGVIYTDSIYTPVYNVSYKVENTRVGNTTDYDKLTLEVKTNSVLSAREAVSQGAKILNEHLNQFITLADLTPDDPPDEHPGGAETAEDDKRLEILIGDLDLSVRSTNCLLRQSITTVRDLTSKTYAELGKVRNLGKKSLDEVVQKIHSMGLELRPDDEE